MSRHRRQSSINNKLRNNILIQSAIYVARKQSLQCSCLVRVMDWHKNDTGKNMIIWDPQNTGVCVKSMM